MRVADKVALVTGGGSGIGEACCRRLAAEGATVVITDIRVEEAQRVAEDITSQGGRASAHAQDTTQEEQWQAICQAIVAEQGALDILVNNAGVALPGSVEDTSLEDWRFVNAVNTEGVFLGMRHCIPVMRKPGGSVINISSIEGIVGDPLLIAYNASKGAVRTMTKSAALHCAQAGYGIRVNSIHPGFIETAMVETGVAAMGEAAEGFQSRVLSEIPVGHMGEAVDIANAALFLASEESRYMTGSELVVDGGFTAH